MILCVVMLASIAPIADFAQAQEFTLTILNPKAEVERIPITPLAERLDTFAGKKIATYNLSIAANMTSITTIMAERFGASSTVPTAGNPMGVSFGAADTKSGVGLTANFTQYESLSRGADAVIVGTAY